MPSLLGLYRFTGSRPRGGDHKEPDRNGTQVQRAGECMIWFIAGLFLFLCIGLFLFALMDIAKKCIGSDEGKRVKA